MAEQSAIDRTLETAISAFDGIGRISEIDTTSHKDAIELTWHGYRLRISTSLHVDIVDGHLLESNALTYSVRKLLQITDREMRAAANA